MDRSLLLIALCALLLARDPMPVLAAPLSASAERPAAARALDALVVGLATGRVDRGKIVADLPTDPERRTVLLTFRREGRAARIREGEGKGLAAAVVAALDGLEHAGTLGEQAFLARLDVVTERRALIDLRGLSAGELVPGLDGLAVGDEPVVYLLPAELLVAGVFNARGEIRRGALDRLLRSRRPRDESDRGDATSVRSARPFRTEAWIASPGSPAARLYRGRIPRFRFTSDQLLEAARSAGRYLVQATESNGEFLYSYVADQDRAAESYNLVRHAGTAYSLLELHAATGDRLVLAAAERALAFLLRSVQRWEKTGPDRLVVVEGDRVKLGGVALAVLALVEHAKVTGRRDHLERCQGLARYMADQQRDSGEFVSQRLWPSGEARDWKSEYYPGEAVFALVRLHALDGRREWLDVAARGADWLIGVRDRGVPVNRLIHDHWLLYGLSELHAHRPKPHYVEQSIRICRAIAGKQNRGGQVPDVAGSFASPPRSTPTATRAEGLLAAYRLARTQGRAEEAELMLRTAVRCMGYQLQTQITPAVALFLPAPRRALGGFTGSLDHFEIRIDYVQHNLSALLALWRVMRAREVDELGEPLRW